MSLRIREDSSRSRPAAHWLRRRKALLAFEALEDRLMLDATPDIVVGRTLSSYTVGGVQGNRETITYTVYNGQPGSLTGVLLTTTLAPGVTFADASVVPDRLGQDLTWNLGTIAAFGRMSVSLSVSLASPTPTRLDRGARAFAILDAGSVSDAAPEATLRPGTVDPALLASTPDANTTDPYVQEAAARLDYDPQRIFASLRDDVGYESYAGSVRGARGTLWSGAGNALDVASLGVALMRASGIPAEYVRGTLPDGLARPLIVSMFPAPLRTVGYIPPGTPTADPANDPQLLAEARDHAWFRFDAGAGMRDVDPLIAGAQVGQAFATPTATFAEVPDALREKTRVQLTAEITTPGFLLGLPSQKETVVLDRTFNDVELVGHPLTIGQFVSSRNFGFIIGGTVNTYAPYIAVGDDANPDPRQDHLIRGTDFQETLTNFPFGSQVLTGLFLDVTLQGPQGGPQSYHKALYDAIGFDVRQNGGTPSGGARNGAAPVLSPLQVWSLGVLPGVQDPRTAFTNPEVLAGLYATLGKQGAAGQTTIAAGTLTSVLIGQTRDYLASLQVDSDESNRPFAEESLVAAYFARPRLTTISADLSIQGAPGTGTATFTFEADLLGDFPRVVTAPGQAGSAAGAFRRLRGITEDQVETDLFPQPAPDSGLRVVTQLSTTTVFRAARDQGIPLVELTPEDLSVVDGLAISSEAKARITAALRAGKGVAVPQRAVTIGAAPTVAWLEIDPQTGETVGVGENGSHQAIVTYVSVLGLIGIGLEAAVYFQGEAAATLVFSFLRPTGPRPFRDFLRPQGGEFAPGRTPRSIKEAVLRVLEIQVSAAIRDVQDAPELFKIGFERQIRSLQALYEFELKRQIPDPPVPEALIAAPGPILPIDEAARGATLPANAAAGAVSGTAPAAGLAVAGGLRADWASADTGAFLAGSLTVGAATVSDAAGAPIGSGAVALNLPGDGLVSVAIAGPVTYSVRGTGDLAFYETAATGLAVAARWDAYTAAISGGATLTLTTDALVLDGRALPAGTYTIATGSATLTGRGPSTSPTFSGSASVVTDGARVVLGRGAGGVAVGGAPLDPTEGATLTGFSGRIDVAAGGGADDRATLSGTAAQRIQVLGGPAALTTDQNTPVTFRADVRTSLAGTYSIFVEAPTGWRVNFDTQGNVNVTPAPGTQGGTYAVRVLVESEADPTLEARAVVLVTVTPTAPGVALTVAADPVTSVPFGGAQVPSAFQASVRNLGPAADTFHLSFSAPPAGFAFLETPRTLAIPAGETGAAGIYLRPVGALPAPGTVVSFTVTATSATDPSVTATQTVSFTVPEIHGVLLTSDPPAVNTTPGVAGTAVITVQAVGNAPESFTLTAVASPGLAVSGLGPVSLAPGQSTARTVTLTPSASVPLNSLLDVTITATFGAVGPPEVPAVAIPVRVVVPGADAIADASVASRQLGNADLADRLDDLARALTSLVTDPANPIPKGQALANLDSLIGQLAGDAFLAAFGGDLTTARGALANAATAGDVLTAANNLGNALGSLGAVLSDLARHGFTLDLEPNQVVALPQAPAHFDLSLQNTGSETTTYTFRVSGLPAGVTASFSRPSVTLMPGEVILNGRPDSVRLTLTQAGGDLVAAGFTVTVTAEGTPAIARSAQGVLTVREAFVRVTEVRANPAFTDPGGQVQVSARVLNAVNRQQQALASFVVRGPNGQVVFASTPVPVTLTVLASLTAVDLGTLNTTGLARGNYTLEVSLTDPAGQPVPGGTGLGTLLVGSPVSATLTTSPTTLPPGTGTVTNTIQVSSLTSSPSPLSLRGLVDTSAIGSGVALRDNLAYVSGTEDLSIVDVSDPANPRVVKTFTGGMLSTGGSHNLVQVVGGRLIVVSQANFNEFAFQVLVFSLADPLNPQFLGASSFNYAGFADLLVRGDSVFLPFSSFFTFVGGTDIIDQGGDFVAVDIADPTQQRLADVLFNNRGTPLGGSRHINGGALVDGGIAYLASTTLQGGDTQNGIGRVLVVDVTDPGNLTVVRALDIPGTVELHDVAVQGNRALVVGATGGLQDPITGVNFGFTGNITLSVLDITDPRDPRVLGPTLVTRGVFPRGVVPQTLASDLEAKDLGNGLFAISGTMLDGKPVIMLVDARDPNNILVGVTETSAVVGNLAVSGNLLYTISADGLAIYDIGQVLGVPVTVSARVPNGTSVAVVPGSFNTSPTRILSGPGFDTLVWERSLGAGTTDLTLSWQSTVSDLRPGEARAVTLGTTVDFVSQVTTGTLDLPGTSVVSEHIIGLSPSSRTAQPAAPATYTVTLSNPTAAPVTYSLSVQGVPATWVALAPTATVGPGGTLDVPLTLTSGSFDAPAEYGFAVTASAATGATDSVQGTLTLAGQPAVSPDPEARGVVAALTPAQLVAGQGTAARFVVRLTNTGSVADTFALTALDLPGGVAAAFESADVEVLPGASNFRDVALILTPAPGTTPGPLAFRVRAVSTTRPSVSGTASGTLAVVANGVRVGLAPGSGAPGTTFRMTVTNTGTATDTFDLSLAGPVALVASLATSRVTLAPGASTVVTIATPAIGFAVPGPLGLTAIATSSGNPAVRDAASADIGVGAFSGLSANLSPAVKVLPVPGTSSFQLIVENTGNTEDSYEAVITGTSGPVRASLAGLDGLPTQTIPLFRLPGLATGAILIDADLLAPGEGTVKVRVRSLTDSAMTATQTATVSTQAATVATTTRIVASPSPSTFGRAVTLTAIVTPASGQAQPAGNVIFTIDGRPEPSVALRVGDGEARATLVTTTLAAGPHSVRASFVGTAAFDASTSASASLKVNRASSTTALVVSPGTAVAERPVRLVATVRVDGPSAPTGTVTFRDGARVLAAVRLGAPANGTIRVAQSGRTATVSLTAALPAGRHVLSAVYSGDARYTPSAGTTVARVDAPPGALGGPRVVGVGRFGVHAQPTALRLTFDRPLDPARASDPANYRIVTVGGPGRGGDRPGAVIPVASVAYLPGSTSLEVFPARRLDVHNTYRLTVDGTAAGGVTDTSGRLLDGRGVGVQGSDFVADITRATLVGPTAAAVDALARARQLGVSGRLGRRPAERARRR